MNASMEMKILELDKMLELRAQLAATQSKLGMNVGFDKDEAVIIYNLKEFIEIADYVGERIRKGDRTSSGMIIYYFCYKGITFRRFVFPEEEKQLEQG